MADQRASTILEGQDVLFVDTGNGRAMAVSIDAGAEIRRQRVRKITDARDVKFIDTGAGSALAVYTV